MRHAGRSAGRILLDSIQKVRAGKNARDAGANPIVESTAGLPRLFVKRERRLDLLGSDRTPISPPCEICENLRCAGHLVRICPRTRAWMAHKEPSPAWPFAKPKHVVRAVDRNRPQLRQAPDHVDFLAVALRRLPDVLQLERPL